MDTQSNFETKNKKDEGNELQVIYFKKNLQKEKYSSPNYSFEAKKTNENRSQVHEDSNEINFEEMNSSIESKLSKTNQMIENESFSSELFEGYRSFTYVNGDKYKGFFKGGLRHGYGTYNYHDGGL